MKKISLITIMLVICSLAFADSQTEIMEDTGLELASPEKISQTRGKDEIPENGLLLVPDSGGDRVMAFYPDTGDLYDENFIPSDPTNLATPIQTAFHPDKNSFLVSDQINDGLIQYDLDGNFMGWFAPAGGVNNNILDNVRGWELKENNNILVTCASGTNQHAIAEFDANGNFLGNFISPNPTQMAGPWSIICRRNYGDYLVTADGTDAVHQYDVSGTWIGDLVPSINFPEQISIASTGNLLVAAFSSPSGVYEYTDDGTYVGYYGVVTGLRGVYELGNGNILVTNGSGVYEINRANELVSTKISGVNARFISFIEGSGPGPGIDEPVEQSSIQNVPNPMRNVTTIFFTRAQVAQNASVKIYNTIGQLVKELPIARDQNQVEWNGTDRNGNAVSNGIYFYTLETKDGIISNKLLLLK
jgi:hypothetical protein